uniref:Orf405 n=1 Tax=Cereibacter sphaeroides TaxID=1063 RepID=Q9RFE6_CERSP|nr:Orf405 [Cereibacter sphaeroides]
MAEGLAPARLSRTALRETLVAQIRDGQVAGIPVAALDSPEARDRAYTALEARGLVPPGATEDEVTATLDRFRFLDLYAEPDPAVTEAASAALARIGRTVGLMQAADLALDAASLASIYFLAAIGLAITFGVMRVINMAHGEFIMMGAYTGYVVQQWISDYTISILVALPLAFDRHLRVPASTMERLVIRHLYRRPLAKNAAGHVRHLHRAAAARPKNIFRHPGPASSTAPAWLDERAEASNDVVSIQLHHASRSSSSQRSSIGVFPLHHDAHPPRARGAGGNSRTPTMAASMGINPDRINMLTFGLGSGIAGIAGVAIGLFAKVTFELGQDYIVQSFMTVVVGGVGNIWGTLAGAAMIGGVQKGIEWLNPLNTLAAQTYMILFIIIFIQFRPRGIVALKGRAAGD